MTLQKYPLRWSLILLIVLAVTGFFAAGLARLEFSTDLLATLPQNDPVLSDAYAVIMHNPIQERVIIDLSHQSQDVTMLTEAAVFIENRLRESALFKEVGLKHLQQLVPELSSHVARQLPLLFSEHELEKTLEPLLSPEKVREVLSENYSQLMGIEGIGQSEFISHDPLGLRNIVLSRLFSLLPGREARFFKGYLVSPDQKHLLLIAVPARSGMDTELARRITDLIGNVSIELNERFAQQDIFSLTSVGSYRTVLENELNAKRNVKKAVVFSTFAIAFLLFIAFPRPLIGLLALIPACAGTMMALFVYSLFYRSISMLAVGFGGVITAFTVDYGIAYLLFLDRPYETKGKKASGEVWSLGLLAMLTTAISFAALSLSGFPALVEIGQFAALGVIFSYIFVHAIFPIVFPSMPPAKRDPYMPIQKLVNTIASSQGTWKAFAALLLGAVMLFFATPKFNINLTDLNAVDGKTIEAEGLIEGVWGNISDRVYVMIEAHSENELHQQGDELAVILNEELAAGVLLPTFTSSMVFPGEELANKNGIAWKKFWDANRIAGLKANMREVSRDLGFSQDAFNPFFEVLTQKRFPPIDIPEQLQSLLGISTNEDKSSWVQILSLVPGPSYQGEDFYKRCSSTGFIRTFDLTFFNEKLGSVLLIAFVKMALIVSVVTLIVAFFYFMDWQLTLLGIAPTAFALICTLGTLNLTGQPLSIPTIMVAVVVIGMGTDYTFYIIRAYQRYLDEKNLAVGLIRMSVFLSFATTFLGFGVLAVCDNAMLKSAGLGLSMGIGYSFLGTIVIIPPFLKRVLTPFPLIVERVAPGSKRHQRHVLMRYRHIEAYPRLFVRFKMMLDPMFPRIADFFKDPHTIIDIGSGYGVPAVWLLEIFPQARIYGIEPDSKRARFASHAIGTRGSVEIGKAPDLPQFSGMADAALMLDIIHYHSDDELDLTLKRLLLKLHHEGMLILRVTVPTKEHAPLERWIETTRLKFFKHIPCFRSKQKIKSILALAGFEVTLVEQTAPDREETWFVARASGDQHHISFNRGLKAE